MEDNRSNRNVETPSARDYSASPEVSGRGNSMEEQMSAHIRAENSSAHQPERPLAQGN